MIEDPEFNLENLVKYLDIKQHLNSLIEGHSKKQPKTLHMEEEAKLSAGESRKMQQLPKQI